MWLLSKWQYIGSKAHLAPKRREGRRGKERSKGRKERREGGSQEGRKDRRKEIIVDKFMEINGKGRITEGTKTWSMAWPLIRALIPSRLWNSFASTCSMDLTMLMHCFNLGSLSLERHVFSCSKSQVLPSVAFSVTDVLQLCFSWLQTHSFPVPEWSIWCPRVCFLWEQVFTGISSKR